MKDENLASTDLTALHEYVIVIYSTVSVISNKYTVRSCYNFCDKSLDTSRLYYVPTREIFIIFFSYLLCTDS